MFKSKKLLALLLVALMVIVAACGQNAAPAQSGDATGESSESVQPAASQDADTLVVASPAKMNGDFIDGFTNSAYDVQIKRLIGFYSDGGYTTYSTDEAGQFQLSKVTNAKEPEITENEDGSKTYRFFLNPDLKWNDGEPITAWDYVGRYLFQNRKEFVRLGYKDTPGQDLKGYDAYRNGESTSFPGVKVVDEHTFELTIDAEKLPYFFEQSFVATNPAPMHRWAPNLAVGADGSSLMVKEGYEVSDADKAALKKGLEDELTKVEEDRKTDLADMEAQKEDYGSEYDAEVKKTNEKYDALKAGFQADLDNLENLDVLNVVVTNAALDVVNNYRFKPDVTAGQYNLVSFENQTATLELNPDYLGDYAARKATIKNIVQREVNSELDVDLAISGDVDIAWGVIEGSKIEKAKQNSDKVTAISYKRNGFGMIRFLTDLGPVKYKEVRQAIACLMDRNIFIQNILGGYGTVLNGYYGLAQWTAQEKADQLDEKLTAYTLNVDHANELLNQTPYKFEKDGSTPWDAAKAQQMVESNSEGFDYWRYNDKGEKLLINHAAAAKNVGEVIASELTKNGKLAGIQYNVVDVDFNTLLDKLYNPNVEKPDYVAFSLATSFTPVIDPYTEFHSSQVGNQNLDRVNDPKADEIIMAMRKVPADKPEEFADKWFDFQVWFNDYLPEIPIYSNEYFDIHTNRVQGLQTTPFWDWSQDIVNLTIAK